MEHSQEIIPVRPWQALAGPKTRALATVFRKGVAPWTSGHTCVHRLRPGAVSGAPESHPKVVIRLWARRELDMALPQAILVLPWSYWEEG